MGGRGASSGGGYGRALSSVVSNQVSQMRGSEAQVRWATNILENTTRVINENAQNTKNHTAKPVRDEYPAWEYMQKVYSQRFKDDHFNDASWIINNRNNVIFSPTKVMSQANTIAHNEGISLLDALKKILK